MRSMPTSCRSSSSSMTSHRGVSPCESARVTKLSTYCTELLEIITTIAHVSTSCTIHCRLPNSFLSSLQKIRAWKCLVCFYSEEFNRPRGADTFLRSDGNFTEHRSPQLMQHVALAIQPRTASRDVIMTQLAPCC